MLYRKVCRLVLSSSLALLVACHPDGDGNGDTSFVYSGTVRLPGGSGLAPAPDGTPVELARIDGRGDLGPALARTTTAGGVFTLTVTDAAPTTELALVTGSGAQTLRALAVATDAGVDPFTETCVRLVIEKRLPFVVPLAQFTGEEVRDIAGSIELVAVLREVEIDADVGATVARLRAAALAEPGFAAFLAAAAEPGQTSRGPGDLGDFFPLREDDLWGYHWSNVQSSFLRDEATLERRTLEVTGTTGTVRTRTALDDLTAAVEHFQESERDVRRLDGSDVDALLGGVPDVRLAFPLRPGKTWLALQTAGASFGQDIDFDHVFESVDARLVRTVAGFEDVETPDGTFADCVRVDGNAELLVHRTAGGDPQPGTLTLTEWYAAGRGLVRRKALVEVPSFFLFDEFVEDLVARRVGGDGHGVLPPVVLERDLGTDVLAYPRSASDGTNHLLVVVREHGDERPLLGLLVDSMGDVLRETELRQLTPRDNPGERQEVDVTFDGTNYVVAHGDQRLIWVQRVSPAGDLLDPLPIQITPPNPSGGDFSFELGSDGTQTLLVWHHYESFDRQQIQACFVTPGGSALGVFTLLDEVPVGQLSLLYGRDSYLLAFYGNLGGLQATRVAPDGTVLDPELIGLDTGFVYLSSPAVALDFDGTNWLAAWTRKQGSFDDPTEHLVARRIAPDGRLLDPLDQPPISISTSFAGKAGPTLAFDGVNHLVAWVKTTAPTAVHLARLTPEGERLDGTSADNGLTILGPFGPEYGLYALETILSRAGDHVLLHWLKFPGSAEEVGRAESATIQALD